MSGILAAVGVALLAGRGCLRFAGVRFEGDTGGNSAVAAPPATAPTAPTAQTQAAPAAQQQSTSIPGLGSDANFLTMLGTAIGQAINPIATQMAQQNQQIQSTLQGLMQPAHSGASALFGGGAPNVQTGESALTSRGYEYARAYRLKQGDISSENAKVEMEVSDKLKDLYCRQGGMQLNHDLSILVPLGAEFLPPQADQEFRVELAQRCQQSVLGYDPGHLKFMKRQMAMMGVQTQALSIFDDTGLGNMIGPAAQGEFIDLLRNKEVFVRAGATEIALPGNGQLKMNRLTGSVTCFWIGETPSDQTSNGLTASAPTTGHIQLSAKKLACLVKYPNDLVKFGGPTVEAIIRDDMAKQMALKIDSSQFDGISTSISIKGLLNYSGVNSITAGTVATDGNTLNPEDLGKMVNKVEEDNIDIEADGFTWAMRSGLHWDIMNRRTTPYSGGTNGQWLFTVNRDDVAKGMPMHLLGAPVIKSNQVPNNRVKGSGLVGSCLIGGAFKHWLIGRVGVLEFSVTDKGDTSFVADQTWMKCIQYVDAAPRYEEAFVYCDNLVW